MRRMLMRIIIAAGMLLAVTSAARADFISMAILGFIGLGSVAVAGSAIVGLTTLALGVAASIGLSYLAKALTPKPPTITSLPGGTSGKLQAGGAVPRSFVVGRSMTAGSLVYGNTYSPDAAKTAATALSLTTAAAGNTPNAYLVQVIALSDIPVTGLAGLLVGGVPVTWSSGATPGFEGIAIPEYTVSGKEYLWVTFYDGTQVAADARLTSLFGSDPDRPYTSDRIGTGVAYAIVTSLVNDKLFSGFPQIKFILDGVKLYDRRYDSGVGGSGSQQWSTPSTWALTGNPVVIAENILRGISYGGKWVYGAQTVTDTQLPSASWTAAASECDSAIALAAGGTELQFYASGEITFTTEPASTLEELLKACNGRLAEIGGAYKIRAGAAGSAVFSFTDGDILSTEQQTFDPFPSLGQTINAVTAKYVSPAEAWNPKDAAPLYDSSLEALDGGRRQPVDINYSFVTSGTAVQRLMKSERDNQRKFRRHALPLPPDAFVLEPLDVISWTSTRNGYISKLFEIVTADDLPNLNMGLAIKELDPNAYDWVASTDEVPVVDGTIDILRPLAQSIVDWSVEPWTLHSDTGADLPAIKMHWDTSSVDINGVLFEVRLAGSHETILTGETDRYEVGSIIISANLSGNTAYQARGQYRPASVRPVTWSDWLNVTTPNINIGLAQFEAALRQQVTSEFTDIMGRADATASLIASVAAENDASDWLAKVADKTLVNETKIVLSSAVAANTADVQTLAATMVTNLGAFTDYQTSVTAQFGTLNANVTATSIAVAGINSSFASYVTTVNAQLGSLSASVTTNSTAVATIGGKLAAQWLVTLDVNGYVSGIKAYNDGASSQFIIITDDFLIAKPGVSGGSPIPVFAIATVNGVSQVALRGNMIADGTITAQKMVTGTITAYSGIIGDLAVNTLQVAGNAITVPLTASWSGTLYGTGSRVELIAENMIVVGVAGQSYTVVLSGKTTQGQNGPCYAFTYLNVNGSDIDTGTSYVGSGAYNTVTAVMGSYTFTSSGSDVLRIAIQYSLTTGAGQVTNAIVVAMAAKR